MGINHHKKGRPIHNMYKTGIYKIYCGMKGRCRSNQKGYENISFPIEWNNFIGFLKDMGSSYFDGASLDRINSSKDYSKENCRWTTRKAQTLNRKLKKPNSGYSGVQLFQKGFRGSFYSEGVHYRKLFKTKEDAFYFYIKKYKEVNKILPPYFWVNGNLFKSFGVLK